MPFAEAKAHLSELAERVELEYERVLVTRNGRPSFVLVSPDELGVTPEGLRHLNRLPAKIRQAALVALHGTIRENPHRLGRALVGELAGLFSARRGEAGSCRR